MFSSLAESLWGPRRDPLYVVIPMTVVYAIIFLVGSSGNIITCFVIAKNRYMHTATNYYLLSLAISDLVLLIIGLPPEMYQIWYRYPYVFGETFCILQGLASETSANATVLTITAFTVERYVAICYPFHSHKVSKLSRAIRYIVVTWITAVICAIPQVIQMGIVYGEDKYGNVVPELSLCGLKNPFIPHSFEISMILFFVVPITAITILYILIGLKLYRPNISVNKRKTIIITANSTRDIKHQHTICQSKHSSHMIHSTSTKRVINMLIVVVLAFLICWAPFQIQRILAVNGYTGSNTSSGIILLYQCITYISGIFYYVSTIINPILYNIMSKKFRKAFKDTIKGCVNNVPQRRNSEEIGSSIAQRNFCEMVHHNSLCSKNSCSSCHHKSMEIVSDFSRRPIIVSFRKCNNNPSSSLLNASNSTLNIDGKITQTLEIPSSHCKTCPALVLYPNCKCTLRNQSNLIYYSMPKETEMKSE